MFEGRRRSAAFSHGPLVHLASKWKNKSIFDDDEEEDEKADSTSSSSASGNKTTPPQTRTQASVHNSNPSKPTQPNPTNAAVASSSALIDLESLREEEVDIGDLNLEEADDDSTNMF